MTSTTTTVSSEISRKFRPSSELTKLIQDNNIKVFSKSKSAQIDSIKYFLDQREEDDAFCVVDLNKIVDQFKLWKQHLPRVEPFYAVKCNPNPMILKTLATLGCGFDVASKAEIQAVLSNQVDSARLVYANPVKDVSSLKFAKSKNIDLMTFDSEEELEKIKLHYPDARLLLRIKADDDHSLFKFSTKFGCSLTEAQACLRKGKNLDLNIVGVSFHVGSKCHDASAFRSALKDAREVFRMAQDLDMKLEILDIGGGFPGTEGETAASFEEMAQTINEGLDNYFTDVEGLKIISEPGRFFATKVYTIVMSVIGKKKKIEEGSEPHFHYYMNDGIYGSFNIITYEGVHPEFHPLQTREEKTYNSTFFGPTCDSLDTILKGIRIPELDINDWCYVENFGAYTQSLHCSFNGFPPLECKYVFIC